MDIFLFKKHHKNVVVIQYINDEYVLYTIFLNFDSVCSANFIM